MRAPIDRIRRETAGVAHPDATWTSFDRYDRYGAIARTVRATLGPGEHRVLDVGDAAGHLSLFDEDLAVVGLDIEPAEARLPGTVAVKGDGTTLPFPDGSFDAVVSSDVLEHVPQERRAVLLAELRRVASNLVVVAAPFDTPGVAGVEELVRRYALLANGEEQIQLEEHRSNGLPDLSATEEALRSADWQVATGGNGNLWDWLLSMVLRFQVESRPALAPLSGGYDMMRNHSMSGRSTQAPYYRHLVAAARGVEPVLVGVGPVDGGSGPDEASDPGSAATLALLAGLIAADSTEVVRQDTVPRLDLMELEARGRAEELTRRIDELSTRLAEVTSQNADLRLRLEELFRAQMDVNVPLMGLLRRLQRINRLRPGSGGSEGA